VELLAFNEVLLARFLAFFSSNVIDQFASGFTKGEGAGHGKSATTDAAVANASLHDPKAPASATTNSIKVFGRTKVGTPCSN
jgi:hypothetical protein